MKTGLKGALILAAVGCVYFPALHGEWLWDDIEELVQNPVLRDPHALFKIWLAPTSLDYYPLKTTVQWALWQLGGGRWTFHLLNAGLHAASSLLLWRLFSKLGLRQGWWGGLLFAVHPLCVESVAWMAELKNTLSLPPLLLAMGAWVNWEGRADPPGPPGSPVGPAGPAAPPYLGGYLRALLWFLVSMLCKTAGVMFPAVLLLYAWWKRGRITRRDVAASLPFFAISLLLGAVTLWLQEERSIGTAVMLTGGWLARFAGAGLIGAFYLCKSVWPARLLPMYPRWPVDPGRVVQFLPWLAAGFVAAWAWRNREKWPRALLFGLGFFLLNLLPVLGWVPISHLRFAWAMDHLAYLPLIGVIGLATAGLEMIGPSAWMIGGGLAIMLAFDSRAYARLYDRSLDLWSYATERNPRAWLAQYNLGVALDQAGRAEEAQSRYEDAVRLNPAYPEAHLNLGNLLARSGHGTEAVEQYRLGLRLRPDYPEAESNLCEVLLERGAVGEAIEHGERAVRLRPDYAEAHDNLGNALLRARRLDAAMMHFREALRLRPGYADACNGLGATLAYAGRLPEAVAEFQAALRLDPNLSSARDNLRRVQAALEKNE